MRLSELNRHGIYKIVNKTNGKFYLGSAVNIYNRFKSHRSHLKRNIHKNKKLQNAWNKYGEKSFDFVVIAFVDKKESLLSSEQFYIDLYDVTNFGYNISKLASSQLGYRHTEETKKIISECGKNISEDTRLRMSKSQTGRRQSDAAKKKISIFNKGKKLSDVQMKKMNTMYIKRKFKTNSSDVCFNSKSWL